MPTSEAEQSQAIGYPTTSATAESCNDYGKMYFVPISYSLLSQ
jgi:hypothetical protein